MTEFLVGDKVQIALPQGYSKRGVKGISVLFTTSMEARFEGAIGVMTQINPRGPHTVHQYLVDFRKDDNSRLGLPWQAQWFREEWLSLLERTPHDAAKVGSGRSVAPVQSSTAQAEHSAASGSKSGWATDAEKTPGQQDQEEAKLAAAKSAGGMTATSATPAEVAADASAPATTQSERSLEDVAGRQEPGAADKPAVRRAVVSAGEKASLSAETGTTGLGQGLISPEPEIPVRGQRADDAASANADGSGVEVPDDAQPSRQLAEDAAASAMLARAAKRREASGEGAAPAAPPVHALDITDSNLAAGSGSSGEPADTLEDLAALERSETTRTSVSDAQPSANSARKRTDEGVPRSGELSVDGSAGGRAPSGSSSSGVTASPIDAAKADDESDWDESPSKPGAGPGSGAPDAGGNAAGASVAELLRRTEREWSDDGPADDVVEDDDVHVPANASAPSGLRVSPTESARGMESGPGWIKGAFSGDCPEDYPIKGNASSKIFHLPGQSSHDKTIPEICFATNADAIAAGYRPRMEGRGAGAKREAKKPRH